MIEVYEDQKLISTLKFLENLEKIFKVCGLKIQTITKAESGKFIDKEKEIDYSRATLSIEVSDFQAFEESYRKL